MCDNFPSFPLFQCPDISDIDPDNPDMTPTPRHSERYILLTT
jgi:hypothetical protein